MAGVRSKLIYIGHSEHGLRAHRNSPGYPPRAGDFFSIPLEEFRFDQVQDLACRVA